MPELNDEYFKRLSSRMPAMLKDVGSKLAKAKVKKALKGGVETPVAKTPCPICGNLFESLVVHDKEVKCCTGCDKLLKDGCTIFLSMDGGNLIAKMSSIFPPEWAGKVFNVGYGTIDYEKKSLRLPEFVRNQPSLAKQMMEFFKKNKEAKS